MASGRLNSVTIAAADTNTTLLDSSHISALKTLGFSVNFTNDTDNEVVVRIALATSSGPASTDWVWKNMRCPARDSVERTGLALYAGQFCVVQSDTVGITAQAYGMEK